MKVLNSLAEEVFEFNGVVLEKRGEIEGKSQALGAVWVVGLAKGCVGGLSSDDCLGVVFAAGNLRIKTGVELVGEFRVRAGIEGNFFFVVQPVEVAPDFAGVEFTGSGAWAYKGWKSLDNGESNPWHDHNPTFLAGVYYLHDPGDGTCGGTEFHDPRTAPAHGTRMQEVLPIENTWIIFPGWLGHKSVQLPLEEPRYVVSGNLYVKIKN